MVEYTERHGSDVTISRTVAAGENVVPAGAEGRSGDRLLAAGRRFTPAAIAVAASVGCSRPAVFPRPRVAILATGDELLWRHVMLDQIGVFQHPTLAIPILGDPVVLIVRLLKVGGEAAAHPRRNTLMPQHRSQQHREVATVNNQLHILGAHFS